MSWSQEMITTGKQVREFLLDEEVVAYDKELDQILPFQLLTNEKEKEQNRKG